MLEIWGQTESGGASTFMPFDQIVLGSIGKACVYNEVKVDPQTHELLIRGPNVFMGYLNQPEKTAETVDAEGCTLATSAVWMRKAFSKSPTA